MELSLQFFSSLLRLVAFLVTGFGLWYDVFVLRTSLRRTYAGPWKYLTFWSEVWMQVTENNKKKVA